MPVVEELICTGQDGTISFGNYMLGQKAKKSDFEYQGDMYKIKTYNEITRLERNNIFVYEFVPGITAGHFKAMDEDMEFTVEESKDTQITIRLENDIDCKVYISNVAVGNMKINTDGRLSINAELEEGLTVNVKAIKGV